MSSAREPHTHFSQPNSNQQPDIYRWWLAHLELPSKANADAVYIQSWHQSEIYCKSSRLQLCLIVGDDETNNVLALSDSKWRYVLVSPESCIFERESDTHTHTILRTLCPARSLQWANGFEWQSRLVINRKIETTPHDLLNVDRLFYEACDRLSIPIFETTSFAQTPCWTQTNENTAVQMMIID